VLAPHLASAELVLSQFKCVILLVFFLFQNYINVAFESLYATQHDLAFITADLSFQLFFIRFRARASVAFLY
jgi:hypothetical protein